MNETLMEGYMKDAQGRLVPVDQVKEIDKTRDALVRELVEKSLELSHVLQGFKKKALDDVKAFAALSAERYKVRLGGRKGNMVLTSYDGEYRVILAVDELITFDEGLMAAKALIDECIREWVDGARSELRALIDNAFAVDKQGKINTQAVLGLRRLDIGDERWKRAMDAIADAIKITATKEYIRIYRRDTEGNYQLVDLNIAA